MKLVAALVALLSVIFVALGLKPQIPPKKQNTTSQPTLSQAEIIDQLPQGKTLDVVSGDKTYRINIVEVPAADTMTLIPNFTAKDSSRTIVDRNSCNLAINGGFYQKNNTPLGLFQTHGSRLGSMIVSNLVTGFFWQEKNGVRHTGQTVPTRLDDVDFILQTGPLFSLANPTGSFVNDEPDRRSLLVLDKNNRLYLVEVFEKDNTFGGPELSKIPALFSQKEVQDVYPVTGVLNLDGGSASFFYVRGKDREFMLSELVPVGSVICVKGSR